MIAAPEQAVWVGGVATAFGIGFTSTVAVIGAPEQPLNVGVIVKVTVIGVLVAFVSAPLISPVPLAAIPVTMPVLSRVQLYVVPDMAPFSEIVEIAAPEQIVWLAGVATAFGVGFTVMSCESVPVQP